MINEKKITKSGSITILSHIRKELGIQEGERVKIDIDNDGNMKLKRITGSCIICSNNNNLIQINGKYLCKECLEALNTMAVVNINEGIEK